MDAGNDMGLGQNLTFRPATVTDLDTINQVVTAAVMGWQLPERVKRLSLPVYLYTGQDLRHMDMWLVQEENRVIALAACEAIAGEAVPGGRSAWLLHGLYVHPDRQRQGIGRMLMGKLLQEARTSGCSGILVRAQAGAVGFFQHLGMQLLEVNDPVKDYGARLWMKV